MRRLFEERGAQLKYPLAYSEVSEEEKDCRAIVIGCAALAFPNVRVRETYACTCASAHPIVMLHWIRHA